MRKHRQKVKEEKKKKEVEKVETISAEKTEIKKLPVSSLVEEKKEEIPSKKKYAGIGFVGNHPVISKFRGVVKYHGKMIGEEIIIALEEWLLKNPM